MKSIDVILAFRIHNPQSSKSAVRRGKADIITTLYWSIEHRSYCQRSGSGNCPGKNETESIGYLRTSVLIDQS